MERVAVREVVMLNPVGETRLAQESRELVPRLEDLHGKVVGFLDESISDDYFQRFEELIRERYQPSRILYFRKKNRSAPAPRALMDEIVSQCHAVITATAH